MEFFNNLMEDHHHGSAHHDRDPPKMPNFFEVDKKKVSYNTDPQEQYLLFFVDLFYWDDQIMSY